MVWWLGQRPVLPKAVQFRRALLISISRMATAFFETSSRRLAHRLPASAVAQSRPWMNRLSTLTGCCEGITTIYGFAGNFSALCKVYRAAERYWRKMLIGRSRKGVVRWPVCQLLKQRYPLRRPKLVRPYKAFQQYAVL